MFCDSIKGPDKLIPMYPLISRGKICFFEIKFSMNCFAGTHFFCNINSCLLTQIF